MLSLALSMPRYAQFGLLNVLCNGACSTPRIKAGSLDKCIFCWRGSDDLSHYHQGCFDTMRAIRYENIGFRCDTDSMRAYIHIHTHI